MFFEKNYKIFLKIYISLISFLSVYYLMGVNIVLTYNAMTEWVINYQGGFVRRGLLGEVVFQISDFFKIQLRFCFLVLQSSLYLLYYYLIYKLLKNIDPNYLIILAIFSPLFIVFPIAELEAIGRKEILIFLSLIISINLYFKYLNNNLIILFISLIYPVILLIFEASIFYSFFFISLILITMKKIDLTNLIKLIVFSLPTLISICAIYFYPHDAEETVKMCKELEKAGEKCGLGAAFISHTIEYHMAELGWKLNHILRYFLIFILGFGALVYLSLNSRFNEIYVNKLFLKTSFFFHFCILLLPTITMFLIAVDTGRWTHMSYSCAIIYYLGLVNHKAIIIEKNSTLMNYINNKLNNFSKILIFIVVCLSWNPKAVYHEDLGSLPLYRAIEKMPNFYINILNVKIFR